MADGESEHQVRAAPPNSLAARAELTRAHPLSTRASAYAVSTHSSVEGWPSG